VLVWPSGKVTGQPIRWPCCTRGRDWSAEGVALDTGFVDRGPVIVTRNRTFMAKSMSPEQALQIAEHQRRRFNELVDLFDTPQPPEVMARLQEIVSAAGLAPAEIALDVGTGAGVSCCRGSPFRLLVQ